MLTLDEIKELIKPIQIVKVLEIEKHPNADRLLLPTVDFGDHQKKVITGAPNMTIGDYVPYLGEGNVIPGYLIMDGERIMLEKKMLRGLESDSMVLAVDEIGLGRDHSGLWILTGRDGINDEFLGKSLLEILTEAELQTIFENQKKEEVKTEPEAEPQAEAIENIN